MARKSQAKSRKEQTNPKVVALGSLLCGLFAVGLGMLEGFVFKSTAVYTGGAGTFTMDPITSTLFILGGVVGIGFAVWVWLKPDKKL